MALIHKDDTTIAAMPLAEVETWLAEQEIDRDTVIVEATEAETRALTRQTIADSAGDSQTLIGTYGDAVTFLLVETAKLAAAINDATRIADIKAAAEPLATALTPLAEAVEDGTLKLAYRTKTGGEQAALAEIATRIGQVGSAFEDANNNDGD